MDKQSLLRPEVPPVCEPLPAAEYIPDMLACGAPLLDLDLYLLLPRTMVTTTLAL